MTYSNYTTYDFTALDEAAVLNAGDHKLNCGDSFTMQGTATVCITVHDNDGFLSGDSRCNENADDYSGQTATIAGANGTELGNGGQIYGESYHWLTASNGQWYLLIEVEQEGTNDSYFTFHNAYGVPPEGTELTVHSTCNITEYGWNPDYKCLDAGEKTPDTGSISGTVFCDEDCDGINGSTTIIEGCDYTYEAEDMHLSGYHVVHGSQASGGEFVKVNCWDGTLSQTFDGKDGAYALSVYAQDESDGCSTIKIKINGHVVDTITLDQSTDGYGSDHSGFTKFTIDHLNLKHGDKIELFVQTNGGEWGRIDKIELEGKDQEVIVEEPTKAGVTIKLLNTNGTAVLDENGVAITTVTDADGNYSFDNIPVGDYKIMGVAPDGTEFTIQDAGSDDSIDSDVDSTGTSDTIHVSAGSTTDIDLGVCEKETGSLSGKYFFDADRDGLDNDGANGISGITVALLDENGIATGITTTTGDDGSYSFIDLEAGTYGVKFTDPDTGRELTLQNANSNGNDDIDSDAGDVGGGMSTITGIIVEAGADTPDNDAGVVAKPGALSGTYFCDENRNDLDDGAANGDKDVAGKLVTLFEADGITRATDIDGNLLDRAVTDEFGDYSFTNLAAGDYVVQFAEEVGKEFVAPNADNNQNDADDSDVLGQDGKTAPVTVVAGEETKDVDAGVATLPGSLSGKYFLDSDGDNLDNDGANGISGVMVALFLADGVTPATDIDGAPVMSVLTGADGSYSFGNLAPGDYTVMFTDTVSGGGLVDPNVGLDDAIDSDALDGAVLNDGVSTISDITVLAGQNTPDNDGGVKGTASVGDTVFFDGNKNGVFDEGQPGEVGVAEVTVTLLEARDGDGVFDDVVATDITDADGKYLFENLLAGDYRIQFGTRDSLPFTTPGAAADDAVNNDSDAGVDGLTDVFTLSVGEAELDIDAGLVAPNQPPMAMPDMGKGCADEDIAIDLSDNYSDADSASVSITALDGVLIADGETKTISGVEVTRNGDEFVFNGETAYAGLDIGQEDTQSFTFTVEDSDGASATATVDVTFCGDANSVESLYGSLPTTGTYVVRDALDENQDAGIKDFAYDLTFLNTGDARFDGVTFEAAYCLDFNTTLRTLGNSNLTNVGDIFGSQSTAALASFDATAISTANGLPVAENLDLVNWVVAQDFESQGFSGWEVQFAIWELADNFDTSLLDDSNFQNTETADVDFIVAQALANGEGFEFDTTGLVGIIVDPTSANDPDNTQPFILGIEFETYDCLC